MTETNACAEFVDAISAVGWSTDRRVDTGGAVTAWEERGHVSSDAALLFAANFDGIEFDYPRAHLPGTRPTDSCVLDAAKATRSISDVVVRSYESRVSETLCPVGIAGSGHLVLLVAPSGRTYGGYDNFLARYGESGFEALCAIFVGKKGDRVG